MNNNQNSNKSGMLIDGLFSVEVMDGSAEIVKISGANLDDFKSGQMLANWEHAGPKSPTHSPTDFVGKVIFCKKIFKIEDCDNERQLKFYSLYKKPCLYGIIRLFDAAGHSGAKDLAAIIRDSSANNEPIVIRYSVEGSTLTKNGNIIEECIVKHVAMTVRPCNKAVISNVISDPQAPEGFQIESSREENSLLSELLTEQLKNESNELENFSKLGSAVDNDFSLIEKTEKNEILDKIRFLIKTGVIKRLYKNSELQPVEDLMREHAATRRILRIYDKISELLDKKEEISIETILKTVNLFHSLVENYHNNMEEIYIFSSYEENLKELELIKRLKQEHEKSKELTNETLSLLNNNELDGVSNLLKKIIELYTPHSAAEDTTIFPNLRSLIGDEKYTALSPQIEQYEIDSFGENAVNTALLDCQELEIKLDLPSLDDSTLNKALTAGGYNAAPSTLVQGSALQREGLISDKKKKYKNMVLASIRDYNPIKFDKNEFKDILKNKLKDVSNEYLDHFIELAHEIHMKKRISSDPYYLLFKAESLCLELNSFLQKADQEIRFEGKLIIPEEKEESIEQSIPKIPGNNKFKLEHPDSEGVLEINGSSILYNGIPITTDDLQDIINELNSGNAKINYI